MTNYLSILSHCDHRKMSHESTPPYFSRDASISLHYLQSYSQYVYMKFGSDKRVLIFFRVKDFVLVYIRQSERKENVRVFIKVVCITVP
jgi:hypothetical protein